MPLPKPGEKETQQEFMQRCLSNPTVNEDFPDTAQRYAVCQSQWDRRDQMEQEDLEDYINVIPLTDAEFRTLADLDLKPTETMANNAKRGLELRDEYNRGGTAVGVARARDLMNRKTLSPQTVQRMYSYFSRHEVDKQGQGWNSDEEGYPSAGLIAWLLWGGDAGKTWATSKWNQIKKIREE